MDKTSTLNNLIAYSYGELPEKQQVETEINLALSDSLREELDVLTQLKAALDQEIKSPNPTSVQIILEESQKNQLETH